MFLVHSSATDRVRPAIIRAEGYEGQPISNQPTLLLIKIDRFTFSEIDLWQDTLQPNV